MIFDQEDSESQKTEKWEPQESNQQIIIINRTFQKKILQKLYPANQIIVKNYSPDVPLKLKLVSLEKKSPIQVNQKVELKTPYQNQINKKKFHQWDTLHNYFSRKLHTIIYLKFQNTKYMSILQNNRTINYFAGFFVNAQLFPSKQNKQNKEQKINIYNQHEDLNFKGYYSNIKQSFRQNSLQNDDGILFSSNFESANLFAVFRKKFFQYELVMQNDINSKGNTQWFYFAVKISEHATYKFNIINFTKDQSLYNVGMKISYFSFKDYETNKQGWTRGCNKISYNASNIFREGTNTPYYTLHFQYTSQYQNDIIIFANCFPYTYTQLQNYISRKLNRKKQFKISKIPICKTISGLSIYAIKFGDCKFFQLNSPKNHIKKKSLIFMARQHSGETPASYIMEGIIDTLIESKDIQILKKQYVIYVIPMINPDGVYYGNYRTNLSGNDMNRKWRNPSKHLQPEIYYLKRFLCEVNKINPIILIIDCHGHSRKTNSFFYGNPSNQMIFSENSKIFPLLCSKRNRRISYIQSTFFITQDKTTTARVVLHQMFPHALVYTFEASFYGFKKQKVFDTTIQQFSIESYKKIGKDILLGYCDYMNVNNRTNFELKQQILKQLSSLSKNIITDDNGSDSEAQIDNVIQQQKQNNTIKILHKQFIKRNKNIIKTEKIHEFKTIQQSTQTDFDTIIQGLNYTQMEEQKHQLKHSQSSLSILRILPLSPVNHQQKPKRTLIKSQTFDNLKTMRNSSTQIQKLQKKLLIRRKLYLEKSIEDKKQKLLFIKNIPLSIPESPAEEVQQHISEKTKVNFFKNPR